jgi:hypothetical protein
MHLQTLCVCHRVWWIPLAKLIRHHTFPNFLDVFSDAVPLFHKERVRVIVEPGTSTKCAVSHGHGGRDGQIVNISHVEKQVPQAGPNVRNNCPHRTGA